MSQDQGHRSVPAKAGPQPAAAAGPERPSWIAASEAPPRARASSYPEPFASRVAGREKRPLGEVFGLTSFGVNRTRLAPGAVSALHHRHTRQQEFVYVLEGEPTLVTDTGEVQLRPGLCAGFVPGGSAHHVANRTTKDVILLEVGDRVPGDEGEYPRDDIRASMTPGGRWRFEHKDGTPY